MLLPFIVSLVSGARVPPAQPARAATDSAASAKRVSIGAKSPGFFRQRLRFGLEGPSMVFTSSFGIILVLPMRFIA